jgi:hypothetical protein
MGDFYASTPNGPFNTALGAAFGTFTTRKFVDPVPVPVILPFQLRPGTRIKIEAEGEYSTTGTPTLVWGLGFGAVTGAGDMVGSTPTVLAESSVITTPSGAAQFDWRMEWRGIVTAVGTAGSVTGLGTLEQGITLTTRSSFPIPITVALRTVAINTTIHNGVGVIATWGTSSASNTIKVYQCTCILQN